MQCFSFAQERYSTLHHYRLGSLSLSSSEWSWICDTGEAQNEKLYRKKSRASYTYSVYSRVQDIFIRNAEGFSKLLKLTYMHVGRKRTDGSITCRDERNIGERRCALETAAPLLFFYWKYRGFPRAFFPSRVIFPNELWKLVRATFECA